MPRIVGSLVRESDTADAFVGAMNPIVLRATGIVISNAIDAAATVTIVGVANRLDLVPFIPAQTITVDQLQAEVTTLVAASNFKLGLYAANADGTPGALIVATADLSGAALGVKTATLSPTRKLTAGTLYWLAIHWSSTTTLKALALSSMNEISAGFNLMRLTQTYASGLPASIVGAVATSSIAPRVLLRLA